MFKFNIYGKFYYGWIQFKMRNRNWKEMEKNNHGEKQIMDGPVLEEEKIMTMTSCKAW